MATYPGKVTLLTNNCDELHQRAANSCPPKEGNEIISYHGDINSARMMRWDEGSNQWVETDKIIDWHEDITPETILPHLNQWDEATRRKVERDGPFILYRALRPNVTWMSEDEGLYEKFDRTLDDVDLCLVIGVSGGLVSSAAQTDYIIQKGIPTIDLNLNPGYYTSFAAVRQGKATELVPQIVDELLQGKDVVPWKRRVDGPRDSWVKGQ